MIRNIDLSHRVVALVLAALCLTACVAPLAPSSAVTISPTLETISTGPEATKTPIEKPLSVRFAVIGDYGINSTGEAQVAALIHSWNPNFVITTGDNNYLYGSAETMDVNIGKYYHDYIYPYRGAYGAGADENRFFPTLGNHDWYTANAQPYLDYFSLPGNERYYDFIWGPVHFFALDSDEHEPDGIGRSSKQAEWLQERMLASSSPWQIVYMHYPPYSSGWHGSSLAMQWPFAAWGAEAVLAGHDHTYERLTVDGIPYFVNGLGGNGRYDFEIPLPESQLRNNINYGAMLVSATESRLIFEFFSQTGELIDYYSISKP